MDNEYVNQTEYISLEDREHILLRPETFVGSVDIETKDIPIVKFTEEEDGSIGYFVEEEPVLYCPAMERVFLEILSNAFDNVAKSKELGIDPGDIKVTVRDGWVTIYNEGRPISTKIDRKNNLRIPQMIFSKLRSGSNFDDEEDRKYAGRNGYGAKLTNIFSKQFTLRLRNAVEGKLYKQTYTSNMQNINEPKITSTAKNGESFTEVSYKLDFSYFYTKDSKKKRNDHKNGLQIGKKALHCKKCWEAADTSDIEDYDDTMISLMARHCLDAAFNSNTPIYFNDILFDISDPVEYAKAYITIENIDTEPIIIEDEDTRLVLLDTPHNGFIHSFANGMCTTRGGVHVNAWLNGFAINLKNKLKREGYKVQISDIKSHVTMFLSVTVDKPRFTTQTKIQLTGPTPIVDIPGHLLRRFNTWKVVDEVTRIAKQRELRKIARRTDGKKTAFIKGIPKLDDAGWAGTSKSEYTTLFMVEGDSAKTFWTRGLKSMTSEYGKARDVYGCFPLRGKVLNTLKAKTKTILENKIISQIKQVLGLKEGANYMDEKTRNTLRYGGVRILTDADDDGTHIKALIIQLLSGFKGLLETGYVDTLLTPVVVANGQKFYNNEEFKNFLRYNKIKGKPTYYKGLGSVDGKDIDNSFKHPVLQEYPEFEEKDRKALQLAFGALEISKRKQLYRALKGEIKKNPTRVQSVEDVICDELITYAETSNKRAIPGHMDGFKDVHRKIMYGALKSAKTTFVKVPRFSGMIEESTDYKHGGESMQKAIIRMAQEFPGSNNLPLLEGKGEFGSRFKNGDDAPAARYISVRPSLILKYIIRDEDRVILKYLKEEGETIEPKSYYPVIPIHLANGSRGMGWGWATYIPNYNPIVLIKWIKCFINFIKTNAKGKWAPPKLIPWFRGYHGSIYKDSYGKVWNRGEFVDRTHTCEIIEIPIAYSDEAYRKKLDTLVTKGKIREWKASHNDPDQPNYTVKGYEGEMTINKLTLEKSIPESNLVVMNDKSIPITYKDPQSMMVDWAEERYKKYEERKDKYLEKLNEELDLEILRYKFVKEIIVDKTLLVLHRDEGELKTEMEQKKYPWSFMSMKIQSLTKQKLEDLKKKMDKLRKEVKIYEKTAPGDLWLNELDELEGKLQSIFGYETYKKYLADSVHRY